MLQALGLQTLADEPVGDYSANVIPPARDAAGSLTVDRAVSLPAVFRSIQITAGMAAQLTLDSWRGPELVTPAPSLVTQPDPWRSLSSWIERAVVGMAVDGNAFLYKHRGPLGNVLAAEVLNPFAVSVVWKNGVKSYSLATRKGPREIKADDIEHVWGLEVPGHDRGLGPIQACRLALTGVLDVREYADNWFQNGDVPSGVLTSDQRLDKPMADAYKREWLNPTVTDAEGNSKAIVGPSVRVLGQGLNYAAIALSPEDAQWLEAQKFGVLDIARMFGIPADYLLAAVDGNSLTYSNLEMIDAQFLRTTLFPVYLRKIEAALTNVLPRGQAARFRTEHLLRPDAKTRAEIDAIYLKAGVIGRDEVRAREGWTGPLPKMPAPAPAPKEIPA